MADGGATGDAQALGQLATLIAERNAVDAAIGKLIGRPALAGHIGEYIAARVFGLELEVSATARGIDGRFATGSLAGRTVNVKWYAVHQGGLDLAVEGGPDFYLVLSGPRAPAASSRGALRPLVVEAVYLFDAATLLADLHARGVRVGVYTSVRAVAWAAAMVFPEPRSQFLALNEVQREVLRLFAAPLPAP